MSAKVPVTVRLAKEALNENKCVVIGLQSTGEARTEEAVTKYVRIILFWLMWHIALISISCIHFSNKRHL